MSSAPPPSLPPRPEVPEQLSPPPPLPAPSPPGERASLPAFPAWTPFAALLVAFLLANVIGVILAGVVAVVSGDGGLDRLPSGVLLAASYVQDALLVGLAVLFAGIGGARVSPDAFGLRRTRFWPGFGAAVAAFVAFWVFLAVWTLVLDVSERQDLAEELGATRSVVSLLAVAVLVTVVAPIVEEFFFRGFLFTALWRTIGWVPAALVSGAVFGLIHAAGTPLPLLVPLAVLGVLLCVLYRHTGSLLPCIGLHAFNNALALGYSLGWAGWQMALVAVVAPVLVVALAARVSMPAAPPAAA